LAAAITLRLLIQKDQQKEEMDLPEIYIMDGAGIRSIGIDQ
jgi:hypothetical protein